MSRLRTIAAHEARLLLGAPLAWLLAAGAQFLGAWVLFIQLDRFTQLAPQLALLDRAPGLTALTVAPMLSTLGLLGLFLAPVLAMRVLTEARRNGALTLLLAAPVGPAEIVLGKFLGLMTVFLGLCALGALMALSLLLGGGIDFGQLASALLGLLLQSSLFAAIGLCCASVGRQPALAAGAGFTLSLALYLLNPAGGGTAGAPDNLFVRLSLVHHLEPLMRGVFSPADVGYFLILTALFLYLACLGLNAGARAHRSLWRGGAAGLGAALPVVLLAGLLGLAAERVERSFDWTASGRHTLSAQSLALVDRLEGPLEITAYAPEGDRLRAHISDLVARFQRAGAALSLRFVDPVSLPAALQRRGISGRGEMSIGYAGASERVARPEEAAMATALQRLLRPDERWVLFLGGHGERDPDGQANHDFGQWGERLREGGLNLRQLPLATAGAVPENTALLVIANPRVALLPAERAAIEAYVDRGGALLWLLEPGPLHGLEALADALGVMLAPGTLVDPGAAALGVEQPGLLLQRIYPDHPALKGFSYITLFPYAAALLPMERPAWEADILLETGETAWAESGALSAEAPPRFEPGADMPGPHVLGLGLRRPHPLSPGAEQRIAIIGDGDFLSNAWLGNGGNMNLGTRLVEWLVADEHLMDIPPRRTPDTRFELSPDRALVLGVGLLLALPLMLAGTGVLLWLRQRGR